MTNRSIGLSYADKETRKRVSSQGGKHLIVAVERTNNTKRKIWSQLDNFPLFFMNTQ